MYVPKPAAYIRAPIVAAIILQKYRPANLVKVKYMIGNISIPFPTVGGYGQLWEKRIEAIVCDLVDRILSRFS